MINYLIIDDEPIAHDIIIGYCDRIPNMRLAKQCYDAIEALTFLQTSAVNLIFLDLNMPKLHGYDFLKTLPKPPKIIVTTAYQEYAVEGYELDISDYLLKPFSFERCLKAINRSFLPDNSLRIDHAKIKNDPIDYIFFHVDKRHIQVKIKDILYIEAAGNYSKVVLLTSKLLVREKISDLEARLLIFSFFRVHKSFIVSKEHIKSIEGNMIFIQNNTIPIGKMYKNSITQLIDQSI